MKRKINFCIANPAGNVTIFVKTPTDRVDYAKIAGQLLDMKEFKAEQVAYVVDQAMGGVNTEKRTRDGKGFAQGKMEMCGLEFCGNASRTFALMTAKALGMKGECTLPIDASGVDELLEVQVNTETNFTKIKMPDAERIVFMDLSELDMDDETFRKEKNGAMKEVHAVDFGGIFHVIVKDIKPEIENFNLIRDYVNEHFNPPAMGVMFWDTKDKKLTPVVYVKDVDSTYYEGSCGSGSTALCAALSIEEGDGHHIYSFEQPAGTIISECTVENGDIKEIYIEGTVSVSEDFELEVDVD